MLTRKILELYKKQNPVKFSAKFGNVDLEKLEGILGVTQPTPLELKQGVLPQEIWKQYTTEEIRALGGVTIVPDGSKFNGSTVKQPTAPSQVEVKVEEKVETKAETTEEKKVDDGGNVTN